MTPSQGFSNGWVPEPLRLIAPGPVLLIAPGTVLIVLIAPADREHLCKELITGNHQEHGLWLQGECMW